MADPRTTHSPYNFVPLEGTPERRPFPGHHRLDDQGWSGTLVCQVQALTPLFTGDHRTKIPSDKKKNRGQILRFLRDSQDRPIVQGTSLKGMIRSVYEALTNSCLPLAEVHKKHTKGRKKGQDAHRFQGLDPEGHHRCSGSVESLCPACRLFGAIEGDNLHARGRVSISDALLSRGELHEERILLAELSTPKAHHYPIYSTTTQRNGPIAGRKLYYHHEPEEPLGIPEEDWNFRSSATEEHAPPETQFTFEVTVESLTDDELANLVFCLELDEEHAHKLGMAKPLGYGSCRISVDRERSHLWRGGERYRSWERNEGLPDLTALKSRAAPLPTALSKLLSWSARRSAGERGYLGFRQYTNQGIDREGRYVDVRKRGGSEPGRGKGGPGGSRAGATMIALVPDLAGGFERGGKESNAQEEKEERRFRKGEKVKTEVLRETGEGFVVRIVETDEEQLIRGNYPWQEGQRLTMRILKVDEEGKIKDLRP